MVTRFTIWYTDEGERVYVKRDPNECGYAKLKTGDQVRICKGDTVVIDDGENRHFAVVVKVHPTHFVFVNRQGWRITTPSGFPWKEVMVLNRTTEA